MVNIRKFILPNGMNGWLGVLRRELDRIWVIKRQTIGGPLLETFLYITVFGAALGRRIDQLNGVDYIVFIIPGLAMMALAMNSFSNNASSLMQQKLQRAIDDQLTSPISHGGLLAAFTLGGLVRGLVVSGLTLLTAFFLVDMPLAHPLMLIVSFLVIGAFFASFGVLIGLRAKVFDNLSFYQTFVIQPLIFLGGVFYSSQLLTGVFKTLVEINPIYYMITTVRYSILGTADVNPAISLPILLIVTGALITLNYQLFKRGYNLRD
jgi:ABC-2 type transport system permease protein